MKVFQIYDRPVPPRAPYFGFMQAILGMSESYALIAPQNFMGPTARFVHISQLWAQVPEYLRRDGNGTRLEFDLLRMRHLTQHFDHAYLDVDVELHRPIELMATAQEAGPGVLVGNGDPESGRQAWEFYLALCAHHRKPATLPAASRVPDVYFTHRHARGVFT